MLSMPNHSLQPYVNWAHWCTGSYMSAVAFGAAFVWAAWYITRLLVKLTLKGAVFSFLLLPLYKVGNVLVLRVKYWTGTELNCKLVIL